MGSSASKASQVAAKGAADTTRRYPTKTTPRPINPISPTNARGPAPDLRASTLGPTVHPEAHAATSRNATINIDASDPDLALNARMRQLGPVQPNPTMSNSSTFNRTHQFLPSSPRSPNQPQNQNQSRTPQFQASPSSPMQSLFPSPKTNPAVTLLLARKKLVEEAEKEFEDVARRGTATQGRRFLDVISIRRALVLRDHKGMGDAEIEDELGLDKGVVRGLGRRGVVGVTGVGID